MNIYCVTSDPFLSQELAMQLSPSEHKIELFSNGLVALGNINENPPDLVMVDTECDAINSIVLINLISRDSKFNNTEIHHITSTSIGDPESFVDVLLYDNLHVLLWVGALFFALRGNNAK